jgi:aspartyl protease family protein
MVLSWQVEATEVALVGVLPGKAMLVIDGGKPRLVPAGSRTAEGVKVLAVEEKTAQVEVDGRRLRLVMGQHSMAGEARTGGAVTLTADSAGHFVTQGMVNGASVRFLVDTGATVVALGASDAVRANIDYRKGEPAMIMTANGPTRVWRVTLNSVRIGEVTLHQVEAAVTEHEQPVALLGMSFLNRMEMKRDGMTMTLRRRY